MSKKVISILLSVAMLVAMVCVGVGSVTASADETYTYYFLAPDNFFKAEAGATNTDVGVYWWQPSEVAAWPGITMTAAPEIGENVFKIEVSPETTTIIFNAFVDAGTPADPALAAVAHQTTDINTEGYDEDCPYDESFNVENFNGMIYVLNRNEKSVNEHSGAEETGGAWFTLDNYKDNAEYYGSYGFASADPEPEPAVIATPDDADPAKGSADGAIAYKKGEEFDVTISFGNIKDGPLASYDYVINYDPDFVEVVLNDKGKVVKEDLTTADPMPSTAINANEAGVVKIAMIAQEGIDNDVSGAPADLLKIKFRVKQDASKLGIVGQCTGLVVIADGAQKPILGPSIDTADTFTNCDVPAGNPVVEPTSSDVSKTSSVASTVSTASTASTASTNSTASGKNTNDNASSKTSSTSNTNSAKSNTTQNGTVATVQTAGTFAVVSLVVILMAAAAVVLYTRKKTEE